MFDLQLQTNLKRNLTRNARIPLPSFSDIHRKQHKSPSNKYLKPLTNTHHDTKKDGGRHPFEVPSGSLGFAVAAYTLAAVLAIALLMVRRSSPWAGRAELGGPRGAANASAALLLALWVAYIAVASAQAYGYIRPGF